jgi:hypothetical protein
LQLGFLAAVGVGTIAADIVASEVIKIGRNLIGQASFKASSAVLEFLSLTVLVNSMRRIEFFFTIPIKSKIPIIE